MRDEHGVHERLDHCNICLRGSNTFRLNVNITLTGCALCDSPSACDAAAAAADDDDDVFLFFLSALLDSAPVATSPKPAADNSQNISYVHRQISASRVRHYVGQAAQSLLISAPTIPSRSRMLPLAVNYDPPAAIKLSFPATTRARSADGPSLSLAQRSGTRCQTSSATHRYRLTVSVASLKHSCLQTRISVHSALEIFC